MLLNSRISFTRKCDGKGIKKGVYTDGSNLMQYRFGPQMPERQIYSHIYWKYMHAAAKQLSFV